MYRPYGGRIDYQRYFRGYERIMAKHGGRPHWAKAFGWRRRELSAVYPRWAEFQAVLQRLDPQRRMANRFLERVLYSPPPQQSDRLQQQQQCPQTHRRSPASSSASEDSTPMAKL
jgi:L-gulonolactone oxidase